jgi:chromosomal replication initiation ATPase DnaA
MIQLAIDLPPRPAFERADFLVSGCNEAALGWIERWPDWPSRTLVLHGPPGCGKSHLVRLWQKRADAISVVAGALAGSAPDELTRHRALAIDDADGTPEEPLLHLYNCCAEAGTSLLLTARTAPAQWPIALPDLASRLRAVPAVVIGAPDDALLAAIIVKHLADRQMRVAPGVIAFLVRRMERSFAAAAALVAALDRLSLSVGRRVGLALARQALLEAADQPEAPSDFAVT